MPVIDSRADLIPLSCIHCLARLTADCLSRPPRIKTPTKPFSLSYTRVYWYRFISLNLKIH